jgi:hypothetical protein
MRLLASSGVLAQHGGHGSSGNGELALTIMLVTVLVLIWTILGVVCWIFWRAKMRVDDAAKRAAPTSIAQEEARWQNAPSS